MELHTPNKKPDWELRPQDQSTLFQRTAKASNGIITPGNFVSCLGLAIVAWGAARLYFGNWGLGVILIIIGRTLDIADGYVADFTKTKSRTGEAVDTTCDKATILIILTITFATHTLSPVLLAIVFLHNLYTGIFGAIWGRRYHLHSSSVAKLTMLVGWTAIIIGLVGERFHQNFWIHSISDLATVIYACFAIAAIISYHRELYRVTRHLTVTEERSAA